MFRTVLTAAALLAIASTGAHADACFTAADLSFNRTLARDVPAMHGVTPGCVTTAEITRYLEALKADRAARKERIAGALAHPQGG